MFNSYGGSNGNRQVDAPRNYRIRLSWFGSRDPGDYKPSPITAYVSATSSMQARMNAQGSYPGYSVTDVMEA